MNCYNFFKRFKKDIWGNNQCCMTSLLKYDHSNILFVKYNYLYLYKFLVYVFFFKKKKKKLAEIAFMEWKITACQIFLKIFCLGGMGEVIRDSNNGCLH